MTTDKGDKPETVGTYLTIDLRAVPNENFNAEQLIKLFAQQGIQMIQVPTKPKPICVVYYKPGQGLDRDVAQESLKEMLYDYHVLLLPSEAATTITLDVFYEKDFTELERGRLQELIKNKLKEFTNDKAETRY